jgi:hypothetical protein
MTNRILAIIALILITIGLKATEPDTTFNNQFRRDIGGWIAADATYSIHLPDGRTLWLFGDTFIGEVDGISIVKGSKFIRNSAVIQAGTDLQTLHGGTSSNPDDFIKTTNPDSSWYWPEHGIVENDTLRIIVAKFRHKDNGAEGFNFAHDGNDIASFSYPGLVFINTVPLEAHQINDVIYGDRVLADTNYLYIYGRKNDPDNYNIPYPHVARTTEGSMKNQSTWEYYNGTDWSTDPATSKPFQDIPVSQQYSVTKYYGKYILLTQNIWLSPDIYTYVSDAPTSPWKNKTKIYTTPETSGSTFTYNAYVHPQFNKNNELLVSYNVNGNFWSIFSNVELYRPQFIRVPYRNISYDFWFSNAKERVSSDPQVMLYPNPVDDLSRLNMKLMESGMLSWELLDIQGRQIAKRDPDWTTVGTHRIGLADFAIQNGIYMFRIMLNNNVIIIPVMIMLNN